jgi:hypothetical protein
VTLNTPHLTRDDFRVLQRRVREAWEEVFPPPVRPFTERDVQIERIVEELGGEPTPKCNPEFWERARLRCDERGIKYRDWHGPLIAWCRFKKRSAERPEPPEGWTEEDLRRFVAWQRKKRRRRDAVAHNN